MKRSILLVLMLFAWFSGMAQLKPRPDAFPSVDEHVPKAQLNMATTVAQMASWDRYPTYETYLAMMQQWAEEFPTLCHVDTIGTSIQGRLILSMYIEPQTDEEIYRPEFFYSSTIHGDEITGYVMMLRLIDTLLNGYGSNPQYTELINSTRISINPLANPDGTYYGGNNSVQGSRRENANGIDLNRNYPDPFAIAATGAPLPHPAKTDLQQENEAMIAYVTAHNFKLSANLHGGSEVMNYPWDCFTSTQNPHPESEWWQAVCQRFVDTLRTVSSDHFDDVNPSGVIAGGDWYVIHGGRQDYMNYYHDCLEVTMEISSTKKLASNKLNEYWDFLQHSLVNYIAEIHHLPGTPVDPPTGIADVPSASLTVYPNPASQTVTISGLESGSVVELCDMVGRSLMAETVSGSTHTLDIEGLQPGLYLLRYGHAATKIMKR
ncbi:MAG: T9SS type A sorting domain-containing protein [Bacteroidales bacterium]|nr:T9SS type A sorting domain-containing protein [Bacteroidales bacterium]